jgi:alpha-D-xyloside xylohydrolase
MHLTDISLERMPVYVRPGAQIPIYPHEVDCTDEMDLQLTTLLNIDEQFSGYPL